MQFIQKKFENSCETHYTGCFPHRTVTFTSRWPSQLIPTFGMGSVLVILPLVMSQKASRTRLRKFTSPTDRLHAPLVPCLCPLHSVKRNNTSIQQRGCKQRANYAISPPQIHGNPLMIHHITLASGNEKQRSQHWHYTEPKGVFLKHRITVRGCLFFLFGADNGHSVYVIAEPHCLDGPVSRTRTGGQPGEMRGDKPRQIQVFEQQTRGR